MSKLNKLREEIDRIDNDLVSLLNKRAELVLGVKEAKRENNIGVYSPERERQIIERVLAKAGDGPFPKDSLERIFTNIISATRSLIGQLTIAYAGPQYSVCHYAALRQFGESVAYIPEASGEEVFRKVEKGEAAYGVIQAETASGELIAKTLDLLMDFELQAIAEVAVTERLALITNSTSLSDLKKVYSDTYYLSRALPWLKANLASAEFIIETNLSAELAKIAEGAEGVALVAPISLAEQYSLRVAAQGIEGEGAISSRFFVIGQKGPHATGRDKTSLLVAVTERAGALRDILKPFADRAITLFKIESRAMRSRPGEFVFYLDILGHIEEPKVREAVEELKELGSYLRVLGSYPLVCYS